MAKNRIMVRSGDGSQREADSFPGAEIIFKATGSTVVIHEAAILAKVKIIAGTGCRVSIGATHPRGLRNLTLDLSRSGSNKSVNIGDGCSCEGMRIVAGNESDVTISIGKDCMISSGVTIRATDGHAIFDRHTRKIINRAKPIIIGDHVWIGAEVTFMKGAVVSSNSVVGRASIVTKAFDEEHVVLAGTPARVVRSDIMWDRRYISQFEDLDFHVP